MKQKSGPDKAPAEQVLKDIQRPTSRLAGNHSKQINSLSQSIKVTLAAYRETDVSASDQVLQGPGHEALVRLGQRRDPRSDVHGDAALVVFDHFDLTRVKSPARIWMPSGLTEAISANEH